MRQQLTPLKLVLDHKGVKIYVKDGYVKIPSIIKSRAVKRKCYEVLIWVHTVAENKISSLLVLR